MKNLLNHLAFYFVSRRKKLSCCFDPKKSLVTKTPLSKKKKKKGTQNFQRKKKQSFQKEEKEFKAQRVGAYLALHGIGVDLTHVGTPVLGLRVLDVQRPRTEVVVGDGEPGVVRDDVLVNRQNRLGVRLDPCHLLIPPENKKQTKTHHPSQIFKISYCTTL